LDLRRPPSGYLLFKEGFQLSAGLLLFSGKSPGGHAFPKSEKLAEIIFLRVDHPFSDRFPAMILGVFIVQAAIQAGVQVAPAEGANFLPADLPLLLKNFPARPTSPHNLLYTQKKKKSGANRSGR